MDWIQAGANVGPPAVCIDLNAAALGDEDSEDPVEVVREQSNPALTLVLAGNVQRKPRGTNLV